jgi:hypothetical protein
MGTFAVREQKRVGNARTRLSLVLMDRTANGACGAGKQRSVTTTALPALFGYKSMQVERRVRLPNGGINARL